MNQEAKWAMDRMREQKAKVDYFRKEIIELIIILDSNYNIDGLDHKDAEQLMDLLRFKIRGKNV